MRIEPFGNIEYKATDKEWIGFVDNLAPNNKVELSISQNANQDINSGIEKVRQFAIDYNCVMQILYNLAYKKYENSKFEKPLDEIKEMYFLSAISLKEDNRTWWLVLEPNSNVKTPYNHILRFTMVDKEIIWANFKCIVFN